MRPTSHQDRQRLSDVVAETIDAVRRRQGAGALPANALTFCVGGSLGLRLDERHEGDSGFGVGLCHLAPGLSRARRFSQL